MSNVKKIIKKTKKYLFSSDYILMTNLMHWLLFIHKILLSSTCLEPQVFIFRRTQLYTCSIWYCHSLWEFLVACRYTAWVRTDWRRKVVGGCLKTPTQHAVAWTFSTVPKWCHLRWVLSLGNKKKSHGATSGLCGGWGSVVVLCWAKNSLTANDVWLGALSWWRNHVSHKFFSCAGLL